MKLTYKHTVTACFIGYIVQAIINNFVPLLFLTFEKDYGIPLSRIGILVGINFGIQLLTDLVAALAIEKTGWRIPMVLAHILSVCGLVLLAVLPGIMDNKFLALIIAVSFAAVGGGLLEVLISPITEACPGDDKAGAMSLLHSFYCWGYMGVVILSTLFFAFFGIDNWQTLAVIWAIVPLINLVLFCFVPFGTLSADNDEKQSAGKLFKNKTFLLMIVIMFCAACCEQSVSQWASAFAEKALGVRKSIGDLVLKECADLILYQLQNLDDEVVRWERDCFLIVLPKRSASEAAEFAEKLRAAVENAEFQYGDYKIRITISCGVGEMKFENSSDDNIAPAMTKLIKAKELGRNRVEY